MEIHEFAKEVLEDPTYRARLKSRIIAGKAVAIEQLLYHYAWGKPIDRIELVGPMVQEVNRLAALYGMTVEEVLAEAEAIVQCRS